MCGIAGIFRADQLPVLKDDLLRFTNSMAHRGPDGFGIWIHPDSAIGFGHRRLSILDLSDAAAQPFHSPDGRFSLTYNGEIFNFTEIRSELRQIGHAFHTESDTEVLLHAWMQWGQDCLFRFNGMWAFALWDNQEKTLTLCRDRFGVKPLYYLYLPGNILAFASETIAFRHLNGYERKADTVKINIALQRVFALEGSGQTPFQNVHALPAGHIAVVQSDLGIHTRRWWNTLDNLVEVPKTYEACVQHLRELLQDACRIRLRSDVPVATALSGGLDSSAVYAMTHLAGQQHTERHATDWQQAFTSVFPGNPTDEAEYARLVTNHFNGRITEVHQQFNTLADRLIADTKTFDSIYLSPVSVASDLYRSMYNNGIRVSLDGHGVDEMAYGYGHAVQQAWQEEIKAGNSEYARDLEETYVHLFQPEIRESMRQALLRSLQAEVPPLAANKSLMRTLYEEWLPESVREAYRSLRGSPKPVQPWTKALIRNPEGLSMPMPRQEEAEYLEFHATLLPTLLRNFDRASMQAGIESRMPFMDYRIVCFLFSLPRSYKVGHGFTKRIIRDAIRPYLPIQIVDRTWKVGFNAPMPEWFTGPLKSWVQDTVASPSFQQNPNWNGNIIRAFVENKYTLNNWTQEECMQVWPYLSAHLILEKS